MKVLLLNNLCISRYRKECCHMPHNREFGTVSFDILDGMFICARLDIGGGRSGRISNKLESSSSVGNEVIRALP